MTDQVAVLPRRPRSRGGADRVTIMLLTVAGFLAVFAILAEQMRAAAPGAPATSPRVVVMRRVYQTTVVDDTMPAGRGGRATVSVSTSGASSVGAGAPAPTTRTSSHP